MKAPAIRWSAALFVGVMALALTGCKNSRNDMAADAEPSYDQVGEVRVYDEPRVTRAETPKVNLKKISRREARNAVAAQPRYDRIGEMDLPD